MLKKHTPVSNRVQSSGKENKKVDRLPTEDFPLEVITLIDVLSRIEIRRQAKLYDSRKEVG